ncbi:type I restriction endonuclease subunit R [Geobacter hydrogenophilus]|uniref:Type I restriction enzyme endonuclease subunit n=1 Tax=Geobacter hydrogenophilus TaxID=40983 RepID=A0A9W6G1L7_9BACT|nr:type I restriction endonuclease subunit R [Geobacter hydrogenophilus]MBT0892831.1 type I restriction endonuclease subunit R [Geobacter hydrogenophilus]GLI38693.1 DEAD/DEAH box helicase [Geobacter hydrogenophilus]
MTGFRFDEKYLSQIPALQLLINLGFEYLPTEEVVRQRQGKYGNVLLEGILREQLKRLNRISYKGREFLFSEENIQTAIQKLKNVKYDGLLKTNEAIYDLITLGTALEQSIEGDSKSFTLNYINWRDWERNVFHVTAEFSVDRSRSTEAARPDIVLFVNGIPLAVIECKSPKVEVEQAVSQSIRNQSDDYIPRLFVYSQLLMGVNKNGAQYATAGTQAKFWAVWKELRDQEGAVEEAISQPLTADQQDRLFTGDFSVARSFFETQAAKGNRLVTGQDRAIYSLCRPERLLELSYRFTVFDGGIKKIARYQQYFVIKSTLERIKQLDSDGRRRGGIIWHTQGSGKSLTMVMLARNLALDPGVPNSRLVLVTDRDDLDKQLGNTFAACGLAPERATSGKNLLELVAEEKAAIVTTLIHKFDKALNLRKYQDDSPDIFMLIDESHRTNFGSFSARMRQMFPNACYLGFTGTPLLKKEKNNFVKFGGLIEPHYSINQAVEDGAVVPLLYEGRHVEMEQNRAAIDLWFERHTQGLTKEQKADLKRKYARASMLNKADQVIYMRAFDISEHYRTSAITAGFKAQLVAPSKAAALRYHEFLNDIGHVTSEVVISSPDTREGYEETDDEPTDEVVKFWQKMMKRYGSEEEYTKQIINQFKFGAEPEILIVVNKLLTGFDAPRNAVIYLCKELKEHTLLQAIARVNRLCEAKEFGYVIDYVGLLGELDKALTMYGAFEGFDEEDLQGTLTSINAEIGKLPQRYSDLWDIFKAVKNSYDEEAYEVLLADNALREDFYRRLAEYSKTLGIALSAESFIMGTDEEKLRRYKNDLKRFQNLKAAVKLRYAEAIDYRDYEPKIKKLLDTHIQANEVIQLNEPVNIFDEKLFTAVKEEHGVYVAGKTTAAKADAIAHATARVITEKIDEDPAFYEKFSKLIQQAIEDFRARRLSDLEYLKRVTEIRNKVVTRHHDGLPEKLSGNDDASAYYGVLKPFIAQQHLEEAQTEEVAADIALAVQEILTRHWKVHFWDDGDAQKQVMNEIDDYLFDEVKGNKGIEISLDQMDVLIERTMQVARLRRMA